VVRLNISLPMININKPKFEVENGFQIPRLM